MNWISGFTILLLVAGVIVGLSLAGTDLLNPIRSPAEADRIAAETRHLDAMNQLEEQLTAAETAAEIARIHHEMELEEAHYQAELARIAADQVQYERMLNIKANAYEGFMIVLIVVTGAAGLSLTFVGTKFSLARIQALTPAPLPIPKKQADAHPVHIHRHSPNGYDQMRIQARQRELLDRYIAIQRIRAACNYKNITPEEYNNLPRAGD